MLCSQSMLFWILCVIFYSLNIDVTDTACLFPLNSGTWRSTDKGLLPVTSTSISDYNTNTFGVLDFECYISSGSKYVARSAKFSQHGVEVRTYICFELYRVNNYQYYYYEGSIEETTLRNERLKTVAETASVSVDDICDRTAYAHGSYSLLVQDGYTSQAASTCTSLIQGEWTYTFTDSAGNTACNSDSQVDICTDKSAISFNYTACSQNIMYSDVGELNCLYTSTGGSYIYQHVVNLDTNTDESTTYRITCLVLSNENDIRYLTQYPNNCYDGQTSKAVVSPGASMEFTLTASCPYTDTTTTSYTAAIAVGVIVPILLIILIVAIGYKLHKNYKQYQENKEVPTPPPDPKFANGEIRNKRMCQSNGVRIEEKATIFDTPRSLVISIDEKLSRPESTATTGSIRRESSILIDMNPSTRGTMVAESLPEMPEQDFSSDYSDSEGEDQKKVCNGETNMELDGDFFNKDEETQTQNVPQIVLDSLTHTDGVQPDVVVMAPVLPGPTGMPDLQTDATQTDPTKTKKKIRRKKSASLKRVKSASRRPGSSRKGRQKPDCYGNTDEKLVFGTRVTVLRIRPKSFRKKKQVDPLLTHEDFPAQPPILERPENENTEQTDEQISQSDNRDSDDKKSVDKLIPDETKNLNTSRTNLKKNDSMLRDKIYRITNRDLNTSKRKKKLPKMRHPLEGKKSGLPEPTPESWFNHKGSSASRSRREGDTESDELVSPKVDEYGNLLPQNDSSDSTDKKRPPTQQKAFVNPHTETTEEMFDKIKNTWRFGNKWLGNTFIAHSPR